MTGVYVAIYVLTFTCFGPGCSGVGGPQSVRLPSPQACNFMKDALERFPGPERIVVADCHGEARELSLQELNDAGFTPTHR
jgi:hypothetical protein